MISERSLTSASTLRSSAAAGVSAGLLPVVRGVGAGSAGDWAKAAEHAARPSSPARRRGNGPDMRRGLRDGNDAARVGGRGGAIVPGGGAGGYGNEDEKWSGGDERW